MPTEVNHVKEYLLTTDEFRNPKVLEGAKAIGILLVRLLLMEPGTNPLHPDNTTDARQELPAIP